MSPKNLKKTPDGRALHLYGRGDAPQREASESEEELPAPAAPKAVFASILAEVRGDDEGRPAAHRRGDAARGGRFRRDSAVTPESRLTEIEAGRHRESIPAVHAGYLRTTVRVCEKQHQVLVCQWLFCDPVNRSGTWTLEVMDFRRQLWRDDVGVEEHSSCHVPSPRELLQELARAMVDHWVQQVVRQIDRELDSRRLRLLRLQLSTQLPPVARIERELGPLAVCVMGRSSSHAEDKESSEFTTSETKRKEQHRKQAELAQLRKKMQDQQQRKLDDRARTKRDQACRRGKRRRATRPAVADLSELEREAAKKTARR